MLEDLRVMVGVDEYDEIELSQLEVILENAKSIVLQRLYPYHPTETDIPDRYRYKVLEIAIFLYNKRGAEGQTYHKEQGVSRGYDGASVPESMLLDIIPKVDIL